MKATAFVIYGCPYTAFEETKVMDAFVIPEPDRSLFHLRRNTNRILNLLGFSGVKEIRLIGCSVEFVEDFRNLIANCPDAGFRLRIESSTRRTFSDAVVEGTSLANVIVVENQPRLIPVAYQIARQAKANVVVIDTVSDEDAARFSEAQQDFETENGLARENGLNTCLSLVKAKLPPEFFSCAYLSATFITRFPYNVYPFQYPTGHLPPRTAAELAMAGLLKSEAPQLQTGIAVVLDSGDTQTATASEYNVLRDSLRNNYGVLPAHVPATLGDFKHFVEDLPADLIFLTAHCGNISLPQLEATFSYQGKTTHVRYAVDRGISAVLKSGVVDGQTTYEPIEVNGISWKAEGCERDLFLEFAKVEMDASFGMKPRNPEFQNISIKPAVGNRLHLSSAKYIGCGDKQNFVPLTHKIGCHSFPLVFNNGCGSYTGVCDEFVPDVSIYVGTTRAVDSFSAVDVAEKFVKNLGAMTVGNALFEAQRGLIKEHTPYLLAGLPWLSVPKWASRAIGIMNANRLLKHLIDRGTGDARANNTELIFQEQQRKLLLKQLFDKSAVTAAHL